MQFIDLAAQQERIKDRIDARISTVLDHGKYIMGPEVIELEAVLSKFCAAAHSICVANGTDAIELALGAIGIGKNDAVFVPSFTFAGTAERIPSFGATIVFVDIDEDTFNMSPTSLQRCIEFAKNKGLTPRVVIPVDLFGLPANYAVIQKISTENSMIVLCDAAQGFGGSIGDTRVGNFGDISTTSFFPAKPLGCYGDGGAVFTNNDEYADIVKSLRVHGKGTHKYDNVRFGTNSRLDTIQAAILLEKIAIFDDELKARQIVADRYNIGLTNIVKTPSVPNGFKSAWAQYTIQLSDETQRNHVQSELAEKGIPSQVYYPTSMHMMTAYGDFPCDPNGMSVSEEMSKRVLSLPMHPYLDVEMSELIIEKIKEILKF